MVKRCLMLVLILSWLLSPGCGGDAKSTIAWKDDFVDFVDASNPNYETFVPACEMTSEGLVVAWEEGSGSILRVRSALYKDGRGWIDLGYLNEDMTKSASSPYVLKGEAGESLVFFKELDGSSTERGYLKVWDPLTSTWKVRGAPYNVFPDKSVIDPVGVLANSDLFVAVNSESNTVTQIFVRKFDGANWNDADTSNQGDTALNIDVQIHSNLQFLITDGSDLWVAWKETDNATTLPMYVKKFNGSSWDLLGSGNINQGPVEMIKGGASQGIPYFASVENLSGSRLAIVRKHDGGLWTNLGTNLNSNANAQSTSISRVKFISNVPYIAISQDDAGTGVKKVYLKRFVNNVWEEVGTGALNSDPAKDAFFPEIAVSGSSIYVVFLQLDGQNIQRIYVRKVDV